MLNNAEAREIGAKARRLYQVLDSRLPTENSQQEMTPNKMARIIAKDALDTILALVARSQERSV